MRKKKLHIKKIELQSFSTSLNKKSKETIGGKEDASFIICFSLAPEECWVYDTKTACLAPAGCIGPAALVSYRIYHGEFIVDYHTCAIGWPPKYI